MGWCYFYVLYFVFCCRLTLASSPRCQLAAFLEADDCDPFLIDSGFIEGNFSDCREEEQDQCAQKVVQHVKDGTMNGNFTISVDTKEEYTIGDILCDKADQVQENVRHKRVHIYWRLCGEKWHRSSYHMPEHLCCEDGLYVPCRVYS